ncbi:MAG: condensation domain-containing protein [Caldilineaceae bacterium]
MSNMTSIDRNVNLERWLQLLLQQGVELWVEEGKLRIRAPQGVLTPDLRRELTERKAELVARLQRSTQENMLPLPLLTPAPEMLHDPFPLTDIQFAYWVGQTSQQELSTGYHAYTEFAYKSLDVQRLTQAWQKLIERHDMLRGIILPSGHQQILPEPPLYEIVVTDISHEHEDRQTIYLQKIYSEMSHQQFILEQWPLFDIRVTRLAADDFRLHISLALILLDGGSIRKLMHEWGILYHNMEALLPPLRLSYRDYVVWEKSLENTPTYAQARDYWLKRVDTLPPAPDLPLKPLLHNVKEYRVVNREHEFSATCWSRLQTYAKTIGVTPTALLATIFAEVLTVWSKQSQFTLNLTFFNRPPVHPQINEIVGDFTSVNLLAIDLSQSASLRERAQQVHWQLWSDLEQRYFGGVLVIRELARKIGQGGKTLMPVVFTSLIGLDAQVGSTTGLNLLDGRLIHFLTQTPQVLFDHIVQDRQGKLLIKWDTADEFFPKG